MSTSMSKRLTWNEGVIDPTKRAKAIREAVRTGKIKQSKITDDILVLLDEIVASQEKTA